MLKKTVTVLAAVLLLAVSMICLVRVQRFVADKDEEGKNRILLENPGAQYDVFWLGSSHMGNIQPMDLWRDFGITSYNLYNSGSGMNRNLQTLKMALEYATPRVVVLDMDQWWRDQSFEDQPGDFHRTFDIFPLSETKVRAVLDTTDTPEEAFELMFPFYRYHSRWQETAEWEHEELYDAGLGSHFHLERTPLKEPEIIARDLVSEEDTDSSSVEDIIELCRSKGIKVMLICLPFARASEDTQRKLHSVYALAEKHGVGYYNFFDYPSVLDYRCDMKDEGHLNMSGAAKVEVVLGKLLTEVAGLEDKRDNPEVAELWNGRLDSYRQRLGKLSETMTPDELITLMSLKDFAGELYFQNSVTGYLAKPGVRVALEQAAGERLQKLREAIEDGNDYLLVINKSAGTVSEFYGSDARDIMGDNARQYAYTITVREADTTEFVSELREEAD